MKDLTKELYFDNNQTTVEEIEMLSNLMLNTTWCIDVFVNREPRMINLALLDWKFKFSNARRQKGLCCGRSKTVFISLWLLKQNLDKAAKFEDTIRHEIAHAIDFEIRGKMDHGKVWKAIAVKILCDGKRCYETKSIDITEKTKYTVYCDNCGLVENVHRKRNDETACGECCRKYNGGKYSKNFILRYVQNY